MSHENPHELTDEQVAEHVEELRSLMPNQAGMVGATRGATADVFPEAALAAAVKVPERPKGMPIGQWLKILAAIFAAVQPFLGKDEPA